MSSPFQERFSDLVHRHIPGFAPKNGRGVVLCLFHKEKTPSLSIDLKKGVFHCFGCGFAGGVKRFAELVGEPWGGAHSESRAAKAHCAALAVARDSYNRWQRERLIALTDEFRELTAEREVAEIALRLLHRQPDLFSEEEARQWEAKLAAIYNRLAPLEWNLDILTYREHEAERFRWYQEEAGHERVSA